MVAVVALASGERPRPTRPCRSWELRTIGGRYGRLVGVSWQEVGGEVAGPISMITVSYARSWDFATRSAIGPVNPSNARERDRSGLPYTVIYRAPERRYPLEVRLVAWADHYLGVWVYDEHGRRVSGADLRLVEPDRLFLHRLERWRYDDADILEFALAAACDVLDYPSPDHPGHRRRKPGGPGNGGQEWATEPAPDIRWVTKPVFGKFAMLLTEIRGEVGIQEAPEPLRPPRSSLTGTLSSWEPPRPAPPGPLHALFQPGARIARPAWQDEISTVLEPVNVAELRIPSGRLIVDWAYRDEQSRAIRELSERIPPGTYPVQAARVSTEIPETPIADGLEHPHRSGPRINTIAVRLLLAPEPALTWELALSEGDDLRLLESGQVVGYQQANGDYACFADASRGPALVDHYTSYITALFIDFDEFDESGIERLGEFTHLHDETSGGDLLAFPAYGDGTIPVWLGRAESGRLVSVLAATNAELTGFRQL